MFSSTLVAQATDILETFFRDAQKEPPFPLSELEQKLIDLGAGSDPDLARLTWEDFEALGIPRLKAREITTVFRREPSSTPQAMPIVLRTLADEASELSNRDLLERFAQNPVALHTAVAEQIRARSGDRPCIALNANGSIDIETSARALDGILGGDDYGDTIRVDGKPRFLYRLGDTVNPIRNAHPVFADKALLLDGTDHHGIYWGDVTLECRQLIYIARNESQELRVTDRDALVDVRDRALNGGLASLSERYPKALRLFEEKKALGGLPPLRIRSRARTAAKVS